MFEADPLYGDLVGSSLRNSMAVTRVWWPRRIRGDHVGIFEPVCVLATVELGLRLHARLLLVRHLRLLQWSADTTICSSHGRCACSHSKRLAWIWSQLPA